MPRFIPCRACKKRRKGCFWEPDSIICSRCKKLQLECVPSQQDCIRHDVDLLPREIGPKALEYWNYEITLLEDEIRCMETEVDSHRKKQRQLQNMEWTFIFENGQLKLDSRLASIEEIMMFCQASVRYLSPFRGSFTVKSLRFDIASAYTVTNTFCRLYSLAVDQCPNNRYVLSPSPTLEAEARAIVDILIFTYFKRINPKIPFLHEPTFLQHYYSLDDPLSCSLVLAVCVHSISTHNDLNGYTADKRKRLAEFFYAKCKDLLVDVFDDPAHAVKTVFTITFLQFFAAFGLAQPSEARRLASISYLLCKELEHTIAESNEVTSTLLHRHFLYIQQWLRISDILIDGNVWRPVTFTQFLDTIPDEPEFTKRYVAMLNCHVELYNSPYFKELTIFTDTTETSSFSLETVFKAVMVIKEWWASLPPYLRLCDDLYNVDTNMISQSTEAVAIANLGCVHSALLQLHTTLIMSSAPSSDNDWEVLKLVRENATEKCLRSCDILLSIIMHFLITPDHDIPPMTFEFIARAIHGLVNVSCQPNVNVPLHLQQKFYRCVDVIRTHLPHGNRIPPHLSPLKAYFTTKQLGNLTIYRGQPMPGIALVGDLIDALYNQLQSYFVHHDQSNSSSSCLESLMDAILYQMIVSNSCEAQHTLFKSLLLMNSGLVQKLQLQRIPTNDEIKKRAQDAMSREFEFRALEYGTHSLIRHEYPPARESAVAICRDKQYQQ